MNFNTLTPTSKLLKKLQNYSDGHPVTSGDVPCIAVINAGEVIESKKLVENVIVGVKSQSAAVFTYNVPNFGYANKISPMTAKYAESFRRVAAINAEAIIKTNMIDGMVIVTDCDITASGLLLGCLKANCPALVLPLGTVNPDPETLQLAGKVTDGQLNTNSSEEVISNSYMPKNQSDFFVVLEKLGFCAESASRNRRASGAQLKTAKATGEKIVAQAKDLVTPKKLLTKNAYQNAVEFCLNNGRDINGLFLAAKLLAANDVKIEHDFIGTIASKIKPTPGVVFAKGSACDGGGYIQYTNSTPPAFNGKAWVYQTLEDADNALLGGNIPANGIVVLQNCVDTNISALAYAIEGMGRAKSLALVTDGICDRTNVLTVTLCTPNSLANEEFANIQNGDVLDIDITRGRFNSSILAKDIKVRAKKNITKKQQIYFI